MSKNFLRRFQPLSVRCDSHYYPKERLALLAPFGVTCNANHYAFLVGADDSVRPYRTRISPQTSAKPSLPTAGRTESSAPTILSYFFRIPFAAGSKGAPRNQTVTQQRGHSLERKKEQADTELSAPAGSAVQRASSDASAILFFLRKEAKRMGAQLFCAPKVFFRFSFHL